MSLAKQSGLLTPSGIFSSYQSIRSMLPTPGPMPEQTGELVDFASVENDYDVFVFDAYGVLNVGDTAIPGAVDRLAHLQAAGKAVFVVTNGASLTQAETVEKFNRMGFALSSKQIVSSRAALLAGLENHSDVKRWGAILPKAGTLEELPSGCRRPDDRGFFDADGYLFLNALEWNTDWHQQWASHLRERPRPVLLGNPDLTAPYEDRYQLQPGYFCLQIMPSDLQAWVYPFGKPFAGIFDLLKQRIAAAAPGNPRVLMAGDTLHTDILGGTAAGFDTALVTGYGAHKGMPLETCYADSGIRPNWQVHGI